jgi:hypothetical protein
MKGLEEVAALPSPLPPAAELSCSSRGKGAKPFKNGDITCTRERSVLLATSLKNGELDKPMTVEAEMARLVAKRKMAGSLESWFIALDSDPSSSSSLANILKYNLFSIFSEGNESCPTVVWDELEREAEGVAVDLADCAGSFPGVLSDLLF